jgi:hypothetical protein
MSGLPVTKRRYLVLFHKAGGRRQVTVAFHEHPSEELHRVVRRVNLRQPRRHRPAPARPGNQEVTRLRAGCASSDAGEHVPPRIDELDAVVPPGHSRRVQYLRLLAQSEDAEGIERAVVRPHQQVGIFRGRRCQVGHRIDRIDGNADGGRAVFRGRDSLVHGCLLPRVDGQVRKEVDKGEGADTPHNDARKEEREQPGMSCRLGATGRGGNGRRQRLLRAILRSHHCTSWTGGTCYSPIRTDGPV